MIDEKIFNNRYRLDRKLGEGGMAIVYCGTDIVLRRRVAVKVLRAQYAADEEFVRRFYQEAESAARLSHPNIVNTYDVGRENDTYFIVMELVDGPSLAEIISADGKLPEPVAIDYATQIASGLSYAHRVGLLHRDIKPANVLVTKDDVVKLSDFGIARAVSQQTMTLTKPGLVMGSVYYMPPEQALGTDLHEASDLYSLGVVLFQMLTGKLPFTGESPVSVALKHVHDPVPTIDSKESGVSPALVAIVNRLLQKKPENRFQSASELATALREARERPSVASYRISDDAPTMAMPSARSLPPRRSPLPDHSYTSIGYDEEARSRRSPWMVVTLIAFLLLATAIGYMLFGRPMPDLGANIAVGDYTNMTDAQAQAAIVNAGLRVRTVKSPSDTVATNRVIRQNPEPGVRVDRNALVEVVISNGKPMVGLQDVRGFIVADAQRLLQLQGFQITTVRKFDNSAKENVIDTQPKPGTQVRPGSRITLTVSNGPQPISVPDFRGMSVDNARTQAARLGITLDTSQQAAVNGVPADTIALQDLTPGTKIDKNTVVHATVSTGVQAAGNTTGGTMVAVPSVVNQPYQSAINELGNAGFTARINFQVQAASNGYVVAQDPPPNAQVQSNSTVSVTLSVPGEVPDTNGMSVADATATLASDGYAIARTVYTATAGAGGRVVGTDPQVGTSLQPGSPVTLVVNGTPP
ncbi:MAG TPA: Stk1 family PASTA domain-containing Ser/Thr kinase [Candidatus Baltobacteraceae bacterium]|jgi:serine/threonine-protein kinase|nr:Stk1 family PASTA domain-containing Ser/Thr kinase [Candidatus Baltobacteraceae bacterium]